MTNLAARARLLIIASTCFLLFGIAASGVAQAQAESGPRLDFPAGLATDGRAVYVANSRNNAITAIDLTTKSISVLAGEIFKEGSNDGVGTAARFNSPDGMTIVGRSLYVMDTNNSDVRKIDLDTKVVTTIAGTANISGTEDGHATAAHFNLPTQIASDGSYLYVADSGNSTVRRISLADGMVKTIGGQAQQTGKEEGPPSKSVFSGPRGVATDGKSVFVSDTGNECIRKIDLATMTTSTVAGTGEEGADNGPGDKAKFNNPGGMCSDGKTVVYILDADNHAIRKLDIASNQVSTLTLANGHIGSGCTVSSDGRTLYYSDTTENSVQATDTSNGNYVALYPPGS
ncbi:MAG TPA: hypothetical protein VEC38_13135 [Candidatus Binataceae bacterium]|nr:hypothetical protein [Candidatus Binataceae bacterium]